MLSYECQHVNSECQHVDLGSTYGVLVSMRGDNTESECQPVG